MPRPFVPKRFPYFAAAAMYATAVRMSASGSPADAVGVGTRLAAEMLADGAAGLTMETPDKRLNA